MAGWESHSKRRGDKVLGGQGCKCANQLDEFGVRRRGVVAREEVG